MVNETGASSAKFLREAANRKGPDEEARARAERGRAKNAALAASNDVQQLSSELVSSQLCHLLHIFLFFLGYLFFLDHTKTIKGLAPQQLWLQQLWLAWCESMRQHVDLQIPT